MIPFLRWLVTRRFRQDMLHEIKKGNWDRVDLDPKLGLHMDFIVLLHTALLIFSLLEQFLSNESFSFFSLKMLLKSSYHTPCIIT